MFILCTEKINNKRFRFEIRNLLKISESQNEDFRGMVSMVSMEVSKTLGSGSSPDTPARINF